MIHSWKTLMLTNIFLPDLGKKELINFWLIHVSYLPLEEKKKKTSLCFEQKRMKESSLPPPRAWTSQAGPPANSRPHPETREARALGMLTAPLGMTCGVHSFRVS